jgi:SSS family solute:Na+ symporter
VGLPRDWIFHASIILSALIVLGYVYLGGLTSAIYNEVLQFFLIVAGFLPLVLLGLRNVGGWSGLQTTLTGMNKEAFTHTWVGMAHSSTNPLGVEWFGLVMGLGFVLSFGYWCTDFLVVQRAMAADSMTSARRTPLIAAVPKMFFPFLVILPGLIAIALPTAKVETAPASADGAATTIPAVQGIIPAKVDYWSGKLELDKDHHLVADYDMAIPQMLLRYFPAGMLGLGLTALLASFMSGMAGNVTAFNTVWTYDIYKAYVHPSASDRHYLWMGRIATLFGTVISIGAAYLVSRFNNIMDALQLVFGFVNAPLFATFLLGMFWKRATGHGAFSGLLAGTGAAAIFHGLNLPRGGEVGIKGGWLTSLTGGGPLFTFPTEMAQNFWMAIVAWTTCFVVTIVVSMLTRPRPDRELVGLVYALTDKPAEGHLTWYQRPLALGVIVLLMTLALNFLFY